MNEKKDANMNAQDLQENNEFGSAAQYDFEMKARDLRREQESAQRVALDAALSAENLTPNNEPQMLLASHPTVNTPFNSRQSTKKPITTAETYEIHSLFTVDQLINERRNAGEGADLRFLIDTQGTMWLARETLDDSPVRAPAHYKMTGKDIKTAQCLTAGNIKFTDASGTIMNEISNKSGDFRPSSVSFRLALALLLRNEANLRFTLAEQIRIELFDKDGHIISTQNYSIINLRTWAAQITDETVLNLLNNQNFPVKLVEYKPDPSRSRPSKLRLGFFPEPTPAVLPSAVALPPSALPQSETEIQTPPRKLFSTPKRARPAMTSSNHQQDSTSSPEFAELAAENTVTKKRCTNPRFASLFATASGAQSDSASSPALPAAAAAANAFPNFR